MNKSRKRVGLMDVRISFPALDAPKPTMAGGTELKYQANFLMLPGSEAATALWKTICEVAAEAWGDRANAILQNPEKVPMKNGDARENPPAGYAGHYYIACRSKNAPDLRDANPNILITDPAVIRQKFCAGYRVNAFIDIYSYEVKSPGGAVIKSGIAAGLVAVQHRAPAEPFGMSTPAAGDFPDCTAEAEAASAMTMPPAAPSPAPAPAAHAAMPTAADLAFLGGTGADVPF